MLKYFKLAVNDYVFINLFICNDYITVSFIMNVKGRKKSFNLYLKSSTAKSILKIVY